MRAAALRAKSVCSKTREYGAQQRSSVGVGKMVRGSFADQRDTRVQDLSGPIFLFLHGAADGRTCGLGLQPHGRRGPRLARTANRHGLPIQASLDGRAAAFVAGYSVFSRADEPSQQLVKCFDGCGFVVFHVEDSVELRDLKQVVHFLGQMQQLQFAALVAYGGESADQFADT